MRAVLWVQRVTAPFEDAPSGYGSADGSTVRHGMRESSPEQAPKACLCEQSRQPASYGTSEQCDTEQSERGVLSAQHLAASILCRAGQVLLGPGADCTDA